MQTGYRNAFICCAMGMLLLLAAAACSSPSIDSKNSYEQAQALREIEDERVLTETLLAKRHIDSRLASNTVRRIKDPGLLARIARESPRESLVGAACDKIRDEQTLFDLAIAAQEWGTCTYVATKRIKNPDLLFRLAMDAPNDLTQSTAFQSLESESHLERIVQTHKSEKVRTTAGYRLAEIRKKNRLAAVSTTTDQQALRTAALSDENQEVRLAAVERITDPQILLGLALNGDAKAQVRRNAVKRIGDQNLLVEIAVREGETVARREALKKLTDPALIFRVARDAADFKETSAAPRVKSYEMRELAALALQDQQYLQVIALESPDWQVRVAALDKVRDPGALRHAALKGKRESERLTATAHLRDEALLRELRARKGNQGVVADFGLAARELAAFVPAVDIALSRKTLSQGYGLYGGRYTSMTAKGEAITLGLANGPSGKQYVTKFSTSFPRSISVSRSGPKSERFYAAKIDRGGLVGPIADFLRNEVREQDRATLARSAKAPYLRAAAVRTVASEAQVIAAIRDPEPLVRLAAVERISDQGLLARAAREDANPDVRGRAARKLNDRAMLQAIAGDRNAARSLRAAASDRLKELDLLK